MNRMKSTQNYYLRKWGLLVNKFYLSHNLRNIGSVSSIWTININIIQFYTFPLIYHLIFYLYIQQSQILLASVGLISYEYLMAFKNYIQDLINDKFREFVFTLCTQFHSIKRQSIERQKSINQKIDTLMRILLNNLSNNRIML